MLPAEKVADDVTGDLGILAEAPAGVGEPGFTEGNIHSERMSIRDQTRAKVLCHAEEHLKLVPILGDVISLDERKGVFN